MQFVILLELCIPVYILEVPVAQCGLDEDDPTWRYPCPPGPVLNLLCKTCRLNNIKVNV